MRNCTVAESLHISTLPRDRRGAISQHSSRPSYGMKFSKTYLLKQKREVQSKVYTLDCTSRFCFSRYVLENFIPYDGREECWEIAPLLSRGSVEI